MSDKYVTNKDFQEFLSQYPDEYIIAIDNVFGWECIHNMVNPYLFIDTDIGQIEIEPEDGYRSPWHYVKDGDNPKDGMRIVASYVTDFGIRMYEVVYYPESPLTDKMDRWMEVPDEDKC